MRAGDCAIFYVSGSGETNQMSEIKNGDVQGLLRAVNLLSEVRTAPAFFALRLLYLRRKLQMQLDDLQKLVDQSVERNGLKIADNGTLVTQDGLLPTEEHGGYVSHRKFFNDLMGVTFDLSDRFSASDIAALGDVPPAAIMLLDKLIVDDPVSAPPTPL